MIMIMIIYDYFSLLSVVVQCVRPWQFLKYMFAYIIFKVRLPSLSTVTYYGFWFC